MIKFLKYLLIGIAIILISIVQVSYLPAWGSLGYLAKPILWALLLVVFFATSFTKWMLAVVAGIILDLYSGLFGQELITLLVIILLLNIIFRHWLVHRNFVSWFIASCVTLVVYILMVYLTNLILGAIFKWQFSWQFSWQQLLYFLFINLIAFVSLFYLSNLFNKVFKYGKS